ncbi:DUF4386 domain-containing protein [Sporosarcina sp. ACRSL]|uniref:DUF4386 domain-containing protein n=1 Tax=Sporosarcina sp. ACRSL TaxID=2918215 RepID=UPI001EF5485F|nr:DUF4386 domain-containing protein [Sporosarcina sp. ACRSL]MCG7345852.1 DUF4386 domain-containing protein [Sporosarcina sp. ACRSL]
MVALRKEQLFGRKYAFLAGMSLLIMAIAASFSYGFVYGNLVVQGDANATFNNIQSSVFLFTTGIFGWIVILFADIVVAWALYIFLTPIHKNLSLLGAWLRLVYSAILGIAIMNLLVVLLLARSTDIAQPAAYMMLFLQAFESIWSLGLIIFGCHLMVIGYLAFKSNIPKVISVLLVLASIGYIAIHFVTSFFSQLDTVISILNVLFTVPMVAGELGFGIWLLVRGGKIR